MDNIIPTKGLHYAKIYGEGRLLHDLKNNYPGYSKNLKPQVSLCALLLLCFILGSSCYKISQNSFGNTRDGFLL